MASCCLLLLAKPHCRKHEFWQQPGCAAGFTAFRHGKGHVDGVLGLQTLLRHKAVINCRTDLFSSKSISRVT